MSASTVSLAADNSTDANFRAWVAAFIAAVTAGGMVRTTDTGQINEVTVAKPAGVNTFPGYAIFKSANGGSLNEWYMRVDFGSGSGAQTQPAFKFQFGWGTDGAGTINSTNKTSTYTLAANFNNASGVNCYFSSGPGWFVFNMWDPASNQSYNFVFSVERTRDTNGAEEDQIAFWLLCGNNMSAIGVLPRTGTVPTINTTNADKTAGSCQILSTYAQYDGSNFGVGTFRPIKGGFLMDSINLLFGNSTHFASGFANYSINMYGASHNYLSCGTTTRTTDPCPASNRMLFRYE